MWLADGGFYYCCDVVVLRSVCSKSAFDSDLPVGTLDSNLFKERFLQDRCQSSEAQFPAGLAAFPEQ